MQRRIFLLLLSLILCPCLLLSACRTPDRQDDVTPEPTPAFDPGSVQLSFSAISDTHIGDTNTEESFRRILRYTKDVIGAAPDVYMVSGDLTDTTGSTAEKDQIRLFKSIFEEETANEAPLLYSLGPTHDVPSAAPVENHRMLFYSTFGPSYYENGLEGTTMLAKGFRHITVKGYHFFAIDWPGGADRSYAQEDLNWLQNELQQAAAEDPAKPIFVSVHVPDVDQLNAVFAKFPQIFCFTGHVHNSVAREDSISQDNGYTSVHCGAVNYYRVDGYNRFYKKDNPYLGLGDIYAFAQGLVVQVDAAQNVRITRIDGYNQTVLGTAWDIPTGDLTKYTDARKAGAANCSFGNDAGLQVTVTDSATLSVRFDAAASGDAGPAQYYQIELLMPDAAGAYEVVQHAEISSQQVFFPNDVGIPELHYSHTFTDLNGLSDFAVVVTAWDCWGVSENAMVYTNGNYSHNGATAGKVIQ
ncbi:MAG: hypothetical protein IJ465_01120 [Clostridia bacterium]|nr:hypothetical protein [Clostridia bacterium]